MGIAMTERYVLGLEETDKTQVALVGGKGANLGELSRIEGIRVPAGFCVTTDAFRRILTAVPWIDDQLDRLSRLDPDGQNQTVLVNDPSAGILSLASCGERYLLLSWAFHQNSTINVWRTNADGSAPKKLSSQFLETSPICSPDGKWVYFLDQSAQKVMRVPIDGGTPEIVPNADVANRFALISLNFFSDDGKLISMGIDTSEPATNDARAQMETVSLDSAAKIPPKLKMLDPRFAGSQQFQTRIQMMPGGKAVVYAISENGADNLWVEPLDGSPGHLLTHFPSETISDFHWSPDGKMLAIIRQHDDADVVLLKEGNQ